MTHYLPRYLKNIHPTSSIKRSIYISLPHNDIGKVDVYIDDFTAITPDVSNNAERLNAAVSLAICLVVNHLTLQMLHQKRYNIFEEISS